jgi:hypothetical protein
MSFFQRDRGSSMGSEDLYAFLAAYGPVKADFTMLLTKLKRR